MPDDSFSVLFPEKQGQVPSFRGNLALFGEYLPIRDLSQPIRATVGLPYFHRQRRHFHGQIHAGGAARRLENTAKNQPFARRT